MQNSLDAQKMPEKNIDVNNFAYHNWSNALQKSPIQQETWMSVFTVTD